MTTRYKLAGGVIMVLLVCGTAWASDIGQQIADQIDVTSYQHFHADELFTHDGDDRGVGGADHDAARDNILAAFQSFGLDAELEHFTAWGTDGYNVVATQTGTVYPDAQYVIGGHYDSVDNPGADDNASGVAGVMEVARVLSQYDTEYTIKYIAFDIEEWGLIGSAAYVDAHPGDDVRGMISMDMIAWNGHGRTFDIYGRSASDPLKLALQSAISTYGNGLSASLHGSFDASNHAPFEWAGYDACLLIEGGYSGNPCYHQACDSVDTPGYIDYEFAADATRSVAGYLADNAVALDDPCFGDLDGDGEVGLSDLAVLLAHYDISSGMTYADGDLDEDGDVDLADLASLLGVYGTSCD